MELVIKVVVFAAQCGLLFGYLPSGGEHRIRLHLEDDERLILPKDYPISSVKFVLPDVDNKFYAELLNTNKKPPKYFKHYTYGGGGKLKSSLAADDDKKCCGNEWHQGKLLEEAVAVPLEELFQPVSLPVPQIRGYHHGYHDDVKPVTEHIEDDLKYDFRTKTHSF